MGLLRLCVTFLTLLLLRNWVYSAVLCPSGDTSGIVKNGQTCSQLIASVNYECYDATIETNCCASCNAIATGISGCQYGDRVANCITVLCAYYIDPTECCFTCRISSTTTTTTTTTTMKMATTTTRTTTPSSAGNNTEGSSLQSSSTATTTITPSPAGTNITSFASQSSSTATTTTITSSPAGNNITSFATQSSSSQSTSAGVIVGSVVGSIAGASLLAGAIYAGFQFFKGTLHDIKAAIVGKGHGRSCRLSNWSTNGKSY